MVHAIVGTKSAPGLERDDLLQEGLIGVHIALRDHDPSTGVPFMAFARICVERRVASALRTALRLKHSMVSEAIRLDPDSQASSGSYRSIQRGADPADRVIDKLSCQEVLRAARENLTETEYRVLALRHAGLRYSEVARVAGCSDEKAVDNALQRVRRKLRHLVV